MTPQLYHEVVLLEDFLDQNLKRGDVAMYVEPVRSASGVDGAILEVFNALGDSIDIATVPLSAIAALTDQHMPAARLLEP
jgi:hypothetical protein